jgi:hypothetical protein
MPDIPESLCVGASRQGSGGIKDLDIVYVDLAGNVLRGRVKCFALDLTHR